MANEFEYIMSKCTDTELWKIISGPSDEYQPAAMEAAKKEFAGRNLSPDRLATVEKAVEDYRAVIITKANQPLDLGWKILAGMFPGLIYILISRLFVAEGYNRKAKELVRWTMTGFVIYAGLIFLIVVLEKIL